MPVTLTIVIAKLAAALSRGLGRGGGQALPGLIAERLDPHLAGKLVTGLPHGVVLVTGTNGKTTTTKLIAGALQANGEQVLSNSTGSNLKRGVVSALVAAADWRGRLRASIGLFEVDEANLRLVAPLVKPRAIVVLNLFRDQLDRYGELDTTASLIGQGIAATKAELFLNADDPLVASLAKYSGEPRRVHFFGIEGLPAEAATAHQTATDSHRCPLCHTMLDFSRVFYGHIGHYRCPTGDYARPQPAVAITSVEPADISGTTFTVAIGGKRGEMRLALPGTYNLYNALASISVTESLGVARDKIAASLAATEAAFGRVEKVEVRGRSLLLLLIKNPAGFTQVLETFLVGREAANVMFVINDRHADGRDVSWLWDVPLEALAVSRPRVIVSGLRGADMALRLHYAGVEAVRIDSLEASLEALLKQTPEGGMAYVLPTYTAMLEVRKVLSKITHIQEAGA